MTGIASAERAKRNAGYMNVIKRQKYTFYRYLATYKNRANLNSFLSGFADFDLYVIDENLFPLRIPEVHFHQVFIGWQARNVRGYDYL